MVPGVQAHRCAGWHPWLGYHSMPRLNRRMLFWEQSAPALADWECAGEAISLTESRPAVAGWHQKSNMK
jgi:hypothetical protein